MFGEESELKNLMLEQPVNNKGYSSIQFLLRGVLLRFWGAKSFQKVSRNFKKVLLSFFGARKFLKCKNFIFIFQAWAKKWRR